MKLLLTFLALLCALCAGCKPEPPKSHIWIDCQKLSTDIETLKLLNASGIYIHAQVVELHGTNGLDITVASNSVFKAFISKNKNL